MRKREGEGRGSYLARVLAQRIFGSFLVAGLEVEESGCGGHGGGLVLRRRPNVQEGSGCREVGSVCG